MTGAFHLLQPPALLCSSCCQFLLSAFSVAASQLGQMSGDMVTLLGPSGTVALVLHLGLQGLRTGVFSASGPFPPSGSPVPQALHLPQPADLPGFWLCPDCGCQRCPPPPTSPVPGARAQEDAGAIGGPPAVGVLTTNAVPRADKGPGRQINQGFCRGTSYRQLWEFPGHI